MFLLGFTLMHDRQSYYKSEQQTTTIRTKCWSQTETVVWFSGSSTINLSIVHCLRLYLQNRSVHVVDLLALHFSTLTYKIVQNWRGWTRNGSICFIIQQHLEPFRFHTSKCIVNWCGRWRLPGHILDLFAKKTFSKQNTYIQSRLMCRKLQTITPFLRL